MVSWPQAALPWGMRWLSKLRLLLVDIAHTAQHHCTPTYAPTCLCVQLLRNTRNTFPPAAMM
jgi:hypothetical protein